MAGRPKKKFTEKEIEQIKTLARCHCPDSEIAAFMECGEMTIKRHFGPLISEQREVGKSNIRAKQYQLAMQGDKTMLVWLGKQLLRQYDMLKTQQDVIASVTEVSKLSTEERREEIKRIRAIRDAT